ncbi:MAG: YihY/virulence factor BrkB family protein [Casimicrobiaceae bacterium]
MEPTAPARHGFWALCRAAAAAWVEDRAASMGAALAYYTAFSIAPLLIIVIGVAGLAFGRDAAQAAVVDQLQGLIGASGSAAVKDMLARTSDIGTGIVTTIVGAVVLLIGATTAFAELQDDLDRIWKAEPRAGSGVVNLLLSRLLSFGMVLCIGFLLTVSLVLSAVVSAVGQQLFARMELLLQGLNFLLSLAVITLLFAMIYKILPNVRIAWADVWVGAAITALLFAVGKELIGLYIGKTSLASSFGAAGPFVVIMVWIYYSTQIFLLGAEFTCAYARRHDPAPPPDLRGVRAADIDAAG